MVDLNPNNYVTDILTFSYAQVWEAKANPSGVLKFSACLLLDKLNKAEKARMDACIEAAVLVGIKKGKFTAQQRPILKLPIRDGDKEIEMGIKKKGQGYEGRYFLNANSNDAPAVTKPQSGAAVPIIDPLEFFSGCMGRAIISFYPYNEGGSRGIAVGLNGIYKTGEGPRLDGRVDASSVFADFAKDDGDLDGAEPVADDTATAGGLSTTFE